MATITTSKQYSLNYRDVLKGLLVSGVTGALTVAEQALTTTPVVVSWKAIGLAALAAGVAYLLKNLFTPSQTIVKNDAPSTNP
jgi:hypothetical protein